MIRRLDARRDSGAILDLLRRTADYISLESGHTPSMDLVEEYFTDAAPGTDASTSLKLGFFGEDRLLGIADLAFGYPGADDAHLGLMMLAREARGRGLGRRFLRPVGDAARERGATRLLLAVLEANPRGWAFWEQEGFGSPNVFPPAQIGRRTHVRIRLEKQL